MPYGLVNSPSILQSFMYSVFRDMINQFVVVYINDILISDIYDTDIGPFKIPKRVGPASFHLQLPRSYHICPMFHASLLKQVRYSTPHPPYDVAVPSLSPWQDGSTVFRDRALLNCSHHVGQLQYLLDWEGFDPVEHLWVPAADVLDLTLVADFHAAHLSKPAPQSRGRPRHPTQPPGGGHRGRCCPCGLDRALAGDHQLINPLLNIGNANISLRSIVAISQ